MVCDAGGGGGRHPWEGTSQTNEVHPHLGAIFVSLYTLSNGTLVVEWVLERIYINRTTNRRETRMSRKSGAEKKKKKDAEFCSQKMRIFFVPRTKLSIVLSVTRSCQEAICWVRGRDKKLTKLQSLMKLFLPRRPLMPLKIIHPPGSSTWWASIWMLWMLCYLEACTLDNEHGNIMQVSFSLPHAATAADNIVRVPGVWRLSSLPRPPQCMLLTPGGGGGGVFIIIICLFEKSTMNPPLTLTCIYLAQFQ